MISRAPVLLLSSLSFSDRYNEPKTINVEHHFAFNLVCETLSSSRKKIPTITVMEGFCSHVMSESAALTDRDKDCIDAGSEKAIKSCNQLVQDLKNTR